MDAAALGKKLAAVAAEACETEVLRVEKELATEESLAPPGGSPYATPGYGMTPGAGMFGAPSAGGLTGDGPLAYQMDMTRRQVKSQVLQVKRGLIGHEKQNTGGLKALAQAGPQQETMDKIAAAMDGIIAVTDDATFTDLNALIGEIRNKSRAMESEFGLVVDANVGGPDPSQLTNPLEGGLPDIPAGLPGLDDGLGPMPAPGPAAKPGPGPAAKPGPDAGPGGVPATGPGGAPAPGPGGAPAAGPGAAPAPAPGPGGLPGLGT
jgi:hypothetical protein